MRLLARYYGRPALVAAALWLLPSGAAGGEVRLPITMDYAVLRETGVERLPGDGATAEWSMRDGCRSVHLRDIAVRAGPQGHVLISARGTARVAFDLLGFCFLPVRWDGYLESVAEAEIGSDWQLRIRPSSWKLLDAERRPQQVATRLWTLVADEVAREFRQVAIDLAPPLEEVRALLRSAVPAEGAAPILTAIGGIRPAGTFVGPDGITLELAIDLPEPPAVAAPEAPEPGLTPGEMARVQSALESFDGFLVFVIKDIGLLGADARDREDLLDLLLETRQQLLVALAEPPTGGRDPVRDLFLVSWDRLSGVVRGVAARDGLRGHAARYLAFLAAGDALRALDSAGPSLGLEISAEGLRRLARLLAPEYLGDPLFYSEAVDPALRELFQFHEPDVPDGALPSGERGTWWWLAPRPANAADGDEIEHVVRRLDRWVPTGDELEAYRDGVARLLDHVGVQEGRSGGVAERFVELYGHLVRTVAWQESCWRQFVRRNGRVTYLESSTGDIGLMQVNRRVWRGLFDVEKLRWGIAYNASAGAQILARLLTRYGVREAAERFDHAARATYSAYNGGPGAYRRYRAGKVPRTLRAIDEAFWRKYQAMAAGQALDLVLCIEQWPAKAAARQLGVVPLAGATRSLSLRNSAATAAMPSRHAAIACRPSASRA